MLSTPLLTFAGGYWHSRYVSAIALALITHLIRGELLDADDIDMIADCLGEDDAHLVRCCLLDAMAPTPSDWNAEKSRARLAIINGGKDSEA
mgnify:FL=1